MKRSLMLISLVVSLGSSASAFADVDVSIDKIVNSHIIGKVNGITKETADEYCIVVYLHTDRWYIHPFASGGSGKSWAEIVDGVNWNISTIKRQFSADDVAALVLKRNRKGGDCRAPSVVEDVNSIDHEAIRIKELVGVDYGKL